MKKIICFGLFFGVLSMFAASAEGDITRALASRLVDESGIVTRPIQDLLHLSYVRPLDYTLPRVAEATQGTWTKRDWNFEVVDEVSNFAAAAEAVSGLFIEREGVFSPRIVCQGGGFGSMAQTISAVNMLYTVQDIKEVFCFHNNPKIDENPLEDYVALLRVVGQDSKRAYVPQNFEEVVQFLKEEAYPGIKDLPIHLLPAADMAKWGKDEEGQKACVVAPMLHAACHAQSIKWRCPDVTITGVASAGQRAADLFEPLYRKAATQKQMLAARLQVIGSELYFINESRK